MKKRNFTALALVPFLVFSGIFTGCGTNKGNDAGTVEKTETEEKADASGSTEKTASEGFKTTYGDKQFDDVTINVEIFDRSNAPEGVSTSDNRWTKYINEEMEKVGIHVNFVAVPRAEETTKIQVMMASGTAPDLIFSYDRNLALDYYENGGTVQLNDYIDGEDQARNLKAYLTDEVLDTCRNKEGELWALTAKRTSTAKYNMFIRQDWLDALDMEAPKTVDELYDVLKAFKEQNPEGRTDVIACEQTQIGMANDTILAEAFMESVADETQFNISAFCPVYSDDGYVEYLRFLNRLYNDGLMDPEYYANTNIQELLVSGRVGFLEWGVMDNVGWGCVQNLQANYPDADIRPIEALENVNDGKQYGIADPINGMYLMVPKTSRNVEAVITYLDWMATHEGGFTLYNGFEGEHYELKDGVPVVLDQAFNQNDKDWIHMDIFLIGNPGYFESEEDMIRTLEAGNPEIPGYIEQDYKVAETGIIRGIPSYVSPTQSENYSEIATVMEENQVKCITCAPDDFDKTVETYRAALKNCGMDDVVAERTEYFESLK